MTTLSSTLATLQTYHALLLHKTVTKNKQGGKELIAFLSTPNHRDDLSDLSDSNSGITWSILANALKVSIQNDVTRHQQNKSKKLTVELFDYLRRFVNYCEGGHSGVYLQDKIHKHFNFLTHQMQILSALYDDQFDSNDATKIIGRHVSNTLLKLLQPTEYSGKLSTAKCGRLLTVLFALLDCSRDNTCIAIGKLIQRLVHVCVNGPLGNRIKNKASVARELEVSNMFEDVVTSGYQSDLHCIIDWIVKWFSTIMNAQNSNSSSSSSSSSSSHSSTSNNNTNDDQLAESLFDCLSILMLRSGPNCITSMITKKVNTTAEDDDDDEEEEDEEEDTGDGKNGGRISSAKAPGRAVVSYAISAMGSHKSTLRTSAFRYLRLHLLASHEYVPSTATIDGLLYKKANLQDSSSVSNASNDVFVDNDYASHQARQMCDSLMSKKQMRKLLLTRRNITSQASSERKAQLLLTCDLISYIHQMDRHRRRNRGHPGNGNGGDGGEAGSGGEKELYDASSSSSSSTVASTKRKRIAMHELHRRRQPFQELCHTLLQTGASSDDARVLPPPLMLQCCCFVVV
jgi:hypothetical protein